MWTTNLIGILINFLLTNIVRHEIIVKQIWLQSPLID